MDTLTYDKNSGNEILSTSNSGGAYLQVHSLKNDHIDAVSVTVVVARE